MPVREPTALADCSGRRFKRLKSDSADSWFVRYSVSVSGQNQTGDAVKERPDLKKQDPSLFKVVLLNDDYTTMEFVVHVLETVFDKGPSEAFRIMMHVHQQGRGIAGTYGWEIAETKAETVKSMASRAGFPLRATVEEA